jgi:erythromycin esterase-like protein
MRRRRFGHDEPAVSEALLKGVRQLQRRAPAHRQDREAHFEAEQNALVVKNAEAYYRAMIRGGPESWNIRDRHMADTLDRLMAHHGPAAKGIVWEHNTHLGDARYTDRAGNVLHALGGADALLIFDDEARRKPLLSMRGQRAIGVVYHPEYEHSGNYVPTVLPRRYDALLYLDQTEALLHPLPVQLHPEEEEVPETFPSGV